MNFFLFDDRTVVALAYFGLALNSDNLAGNVYLNFGLSALVEIPAYFVVIFLVDRIGRRKLYCINMIIGGIACGSTIFAIEYVPNGKKFWIFLFFFMHKVKVTETTNLAKQTTGPARSTCIL